MGHAKTITADLRSVRVGRASLGEAQKELVALMHAIVRRSPRALEPRVVADVMAQLAARTDDAWARGDVHTYMDTRGHARHRLSCADAV